MTRETFNQINFSTRLIARGALALEARAITVNRSGEYENTHHQDGIDEKIEWPSNKIGLVTIRNPTQGSNASDK